MPMNSADFAAILKEFQDKEAELLGLKGADYATTDNRLWNFEKVAELLGNGKLPSQVCLDYLMKHMITIVKMVTEGSGNWCWTDENGQEGLKQRVADAVNYLHLMAATLSSEREPGIYKMMGIEITMAADVAKYYTACFKNPADASSEDNPMLAQALHYRSLGWSVIPLKPRTKLPFSNWSEFRTKLASEKHVRDWWKGIPDANVGIVTGKLSGIVVLDIDNRTGIIEGRTGIIDGLLTPTVKTPKGYHLYFEYPTIPVSPIAISRGLRLIGDGGYVVAPPSVFELGRGKKKTLHDYDWTVSPEVELAPLPRWLYDTAPVPDIRDPNESHLKNVYDWEMFDEEVAYLAPVKTGCRDFKTSELIKYYKDRGLHPASIKSRVRIWNQNNYPPLPYADIEEILQTSLRGYSGASQ